MCFETYIKFKSRTNAGLMLGLRKVVAMYKQMKYIPHILNLFILRNYLNCDDQLYGQLSKLSHPG